MNGGTAAIERTRASTMIAVRLGALAVCGSLELLGDWRWTTIWPVNSLLAALVLNSLAICVLSAARRAIPSSHLLAADVLLVLVVCLSIAWYAGDRMTNGWPGIVLPYLLLCGVMAGIGFRSYGTVAAWAAVLSGAFMVGDVLAGQRWFESLPHVAGLAANAGMACYVATVLTRNAAELDQARAAEVLRTAQLSEERERARTARMLHDRILQTLEALVRDGWIADEDVRARVAEEARWLRAYLRGDENGPDGDVLAALEAVARQAVGGGLHVEFNASRLRTSPDRERIPAEVVDALVGVLREALTNVAKHAGVRRAVVWVDGRDGMVRLSVLDHGAGFEMERQPLGLGISRSIVERVAAVGGSADVESAPGEGTHITVRIPLP